MKTEDILTKAMKLEQEGRDAYLQAARLCDDPETKNMFYTLAEDELHHREYLERQLNSLQSNEPWINIPELETIQAIDAYEPIFPSGKKIMEQLPKNASEEDALLFGLNAEVKSFELYRQSSKQIEDQTARNMFDGLAIAEQSHFNLLMMRYDSRFGYPR